MRIKMIGIDFNKAGLRERELFAFTATQLRHSLKNIVKHAQISGCVIISTCNRTELWISEEKRHNNDLLDIICREKGLKAEVFESLFIKREDQSAILHLFETAGGLRSQILGEDQILAQVKCAIEYAREMKTADELLEKLFQCAITAAKKIKSEVRLTTADTSVSHAALVMAQKYFGDLSEAKCLIIGNGGMGRLASELFVENGGQVYITLRNHKNGKNIVPGGCIPVDYDYRIEKIKDCDIIISATISPHHTVQKNDVQFLSQTQKRFIFIDLAVPRDIDPEIREFNNVTLIDMDNIGIELAVDKKALQRASAIIEAHKADFYKWYILRKYLPSIKNEKDITFDIIIACLKKDIAGLNLNLDEKSNLENKVISIIGKAF